MWNIWKSLTRKQELALINGDPEGYLPVTYANSATNLLEPTRKQLDSPSLFERITLRDASRDAQRSLSWVHACIRRKYESVASCPIKVVNKRGKVIESHRIARLFNSGEYSRVVLIQTLIMHLELTGNAIIMRIRDRDGKTTSIKVINPDTVRPTRDASNKLSYIINGKQYEKGSIIHLMYPDPEYSDWGLAPLQAVARTIDTENNAIDFNKNSILNGGAISGILSFVRRLTKKQHEDATESINKSHTGPSNARKIMVIGDDVKFTPTSQRYIDFDFLAGRKWNMVEICTAFGVPPALVYQDNANYNNMDTARELFWDTISALILSLEEMLCHSFSSELGDDRIVFDTSAQPALMSLLKRKVEIAESLVKMGVELSEVNRRLNLGLEVKGG